jgi:DNA gyrase subunit A
MLVTDQGKLIRTVVNTIRIAGRATQGVTLFRVADDEHVVSAARIRETDDDAVDEMTDADVGDAEADAPDNMAPE